MKKEALQKMILTVLITLLLLGGVVWLVFFVVVPRVRDMDFFGGLGANTTVVPFHEHFALDAGVPQLILDGTRLRDVPPPIVEYRGGIPRVYLRASFLREYIDPFVFWDAGAGVLFVSTLYEMLEFVPGNDHFFVNGSPHPLDNAVFLEDGDVFLPTAVVHGLYALIVEYHADYNMVVVTTADAVQTTARVSAAHANVRYWPSQRAPITAQVATGETLVLFTDYVGEYTEIDGNFVRVRTPNGLLGYVLLSEIEGISTNIPAENLRRNPIVGDFINNNVHHARVWQGEGAINLVWEYAANLHANTLNMETPLDTSVNVVSPVWFRIDESGGHFNSVASREYVDWAHSQGVQVWPLVFDVWNTQARLFLTDRNARAYGIAQLLSAVETFNLDGINIDFEHLTAAEGPYKIQFLRELQIPLRERGVVLSAAVKVPLPATAFYRRDLIGKTVDFVMVMTYDEHWATSPVAGPNASLPFVRRAVENMLTDTAHEGAVPAERLVLGLPFYNRVWRETVATGEISHYRAWGTNTTRDFFEEHGVNWVWDFEIGSYFGEVMIFYEGETVVFRVWLEDARSIQEKMHIFTDNNLGGVAIWMRLFAIEELWEVLRPYFN